MKAPAEPARALDIGVLSTGGDSTRLASLDAHAYLVVNVASACGFTSQYRDLEALYEAKAGKGLVVLGVPCNDFGHQEPGEAREIREFCDTSYHVTFPMTAKVEIAARDRRHPFYKWVAEELGESALPRWNFHKYLLGRDGQPVGGFPSAVSPEDPALVSAVERALAAR